MKAARRGSDRRADGSVATFRESPRAENPVQLAHVVVQQNICGSGRAGSEQCADDPACRFGRLQRFGLEPFVQVIGRAHGQQLVERVKVLRPEIAEMPAESCQSGEVPWTERRRVGRHHAEQRLHRARHPVQHATELVVGLRVAQRVTRDLASILVVIVALREVVAGGEGRQRALERQNVQTVAREIKVANDLRPEQAHHVREDGEREPGKDLLAQRRAADLLATLDHEDALPASRQVRCADQAVVPAADHDRVVFLSHRYARFRSGSKNGLLTTRASARTR